MVQIPAEKIAEVRDRIDIESVVGRSVKLTRRGRRFVGLCPFHSEKTPSFQVSPDKGLYHCFGCQVGGDVFDFVMRLEGLQFPEAVRSLAGQAGVELPEREETPKEKEERAKKTRLLALNARVADWFERVLESTPEAMRYLTESRGLSKVTIQEFRVGWAPPGWSNLTEQCQGVQVEDGVELGLLGKSAKDGRIYDRLRGRVIFPISLPGGDVVGFGARRADWIDPEGPKYLNSPESPIYEKSSILYGLDLARDEIRRNRRAILTEGYLDVISVSQTGLKEVVAACGTALTRRHARALKRLAPEVVTCYDGDEAGQEATRKAAELLLSEGLSVRVADMPEGEDPDSFAQKRGAETLKKLVDEAPSAVDFFLGRARAAHAGGGIAGTTKAMEAVKPMILAISDPLERDVAIGACARQLGIDAHTLGRHLRSGEPLRPRPQMPKARAHAFPVVETELLKMFLESPADVHDALVEQGAENAFTHPLIQAAIDAAVAAHRASAPFDAPRAIEVMQHVGNLDEPTLAGLRAKMLESLPEKNDLTACITRLLKTKRDYVIRELKRRLEQETDPAVAAELAQEVTRVMRG